MSDDRLAAYGLPGRDVREVVSLVMRELSEAGTPEARGFADSMFLYRMLGTYADAVELESTIALLGVAAESPGFLAERAVLPDDRSCMLTLPEGSYEWGKAFLGRILHEVRSVICSGGNKEYRDLQKQYQSYPK
jgi:hypothetical protein